MDYTTFTDDLIYRIGEYNQNCKDDKEQRRYPKIQRETWAPTNRYKAITHKIIGCDDPQCLRLLQECGYDGQPVSSQTSSTIRKWFELTNGHKFPPQRDIIRLAIFLCLDFFETIHFVLKAAFEEYLVTNDPQWTYLSGDSYIEILSGYNEDSNEKSLKGVIEEFHKNLDYRSLYWAFEEQWHMASSAGFTREHFKTLIDDIFKERLMTYENASEKIKNFSEYQQGLIEQLKFGTPEEQDVLWRCRGRWQTLQDDLNEIYIEIENTRLLNAEIEQEYLQLFGDLKIQYEELKAEIKIFERKKSWFQKDPNLTEEQVEEKIREMQEKLEQEIVDLRVKSALSERDARATAWTKIGVPMDAEALNNEKALCKKEISAIRKLVHPDMLMHNKVYQSLSEEKKKQIEKIMLEAMKIQPSELGYPPNFAYHDMRSLDGLKQVRRRIEEILKENNVRVELEYQIEGETILEQIKWLKREITLLENQISAAKGQWIAMLKDAEVCSKRDLLGNSDKHDEYREEMEKEIKLKEAKRDQLKKELDEIKKG